MKKPCIYCGHAPGVTRDHVPPKCFFEEPCPNIRRITVPCCETCRLRGESNDAHARNLIISTIEAEPHPVVQGQLSSARNRAFKDFGQMPTVLKHMVRADVHSRGGIYLGSAPAFNFDSPVIEGFLHRVVKGLLHEEKRSGFVLSSIKWEMNLPEDLYAMFAHGRSRAVGNVFSYSFLIRGGSLDSLWLLTFYESIRFVVRLQPVGS
jgi:hypothetical protein